MASLGDIVAVLRMDNTNFTKNTKASQRQAGALGGSLRKMGTAAKVAGGALAAVAVAKTVSRGLRSVVGASADLDSALQKSFAIQKLSTDQQNAMREASITVARDVSASSAEVAEGFFFLASAGLDAEQQIGALPQVAAFAQAGMFDLATATDLATDAQSAIGLTSKDTEKNLAGLVAVTDALVGGNKLANASVRQFSEAMTNGAAAAARQVGMDISEVVAVLAAFADQNSKGAEAGTKFSIVMRDLQTKAITNKTAFEQVGLAVFDQSGEFLKMADIVGNLEQILSGLSDEQQKATLLTLGFADKSVAALQMLLGTSGQIAEYESKLKSMGGVTQDVAANSLTAFDRSLNRLAKTWDELQARVGPGLIAALIPVLEKTSDLLSGVIQKLRVMGAIEVAVGGTRVKEDITSSHNQKMQKQREANHAKLMKMFGDRKQAEDKVVKSTEKQAEAAKKQEAAQKDVNKEVERFAQLTSSASEGGSVEAYNRIFQTIAAGAQPDVVSPAQQAVQMVKNAGPVGAAGPAKQVAASKGQEVKILSSLLTELQRNTAATKKIAEEAEEI